MNSKYSNGEFSFDINGAVGQVYRIQITTDLFPGGWLSYGLLTNWISPIRFVDVNGGGSQRRFYRVVPP